MQELNNISIKEYFSLQDSSAYDVFLDILKPKNLFCGKRFDTSKMTYDEYLTIISILNKPNLLNVKDLFVHLWRIKGSIKISAEEMFFNESVFVLFSAKRFLKEFIEHKIKLENKILYSEPDIKMLEIKAGERLKPFQTMITKINIGKQFGINPYEVGKWKYSEVLNILATNNALNQVQRDYAK